MENWDQETLEEVVESKSKEYNKNKPIDIKKKEEDKAKEKELNELFEVAVKQPKVPVGKSLDNFS